MHRYLKIAHRVPAGQVAHRVPGEKEDRTGFARCSRI